MLGVIAEATEAVETSRDLYGTEGWWWRERERGKATLRETVWERETDRHRYRQREVTRTRKL